MPTTIKLKNSVTTTSAPSSLAQGEVAINVTDKKVWVGNAATTPVQLLGTGADGFFSSITDAGNLTFTGTGNRIRGDFSNATHSNRVLLQTSTTNATTLFGVIPNGTSTTSAINLYNNSDPTNTSLLQLSVQSTTDARLSSTFTGTGTNLPLTMYTGGSERLRIDTSGNVGIGTSSPTAPLDSVSNSSAIGLRIRGRSSDNFGLINFVGNNPANDYAYLGTPVANTLAFYTNGFTERMRIDSSGNLLVGTTSARPNGLTADAQIVATTASATKFPIATSASLTAAQTAIVFTNPNGNVGSIQTSGSATSYVTSSDYRLKENIAPMMGALARVSQLKPVTYKWKVDGSAGEGFIAHELQAVVPDCVTGEKDAVDAEGKPVYQGIDTSFLVATLTAAIQEQQAMIETLTTRLNALEGK